MLRNHCLVDWWRKRDNPTSLVTHLHFLSILSLILSKKERRAWWIIVIDEREFLSHWLYIGVCTWLRHNVLDMQALVHNEEWENAMILNICFDNMNIKMNNCNVWAFERNVRFTNRLLLGSFIKKCSSKELVYLMVHLRFFCERLARSIFAEEEYTYERGNSNRESSCIIVTKAWHCKCLWYYRIGIRDG